MKYIRTKDGIVSSLKTVRTSKIIKKADTLEELCDEIVRVCQPNTKNEWHFVLGNKDSQFLIGNKHIDYGAIWTDKGLIYVAKMNDKGELELL